MADDGTQIIKETSAMASKKLIAYIISIIALMVFAFTGKVDADSVASILLTCSLGYWSVQGVIDLGKVVKDTISKRNGSNGNGSSGGSVTTTTPPA